MADLKKLVEAVEAIVTTTEAATGERPNWRDHAAYSAWERQQADAIDRMKDTLLELGARFNARPSVDFAIRLGGIRSSSTSGTIGAVRNWLVSAEKRLREAA